MLICAIPLRGKIDFLIIGENFRSFWCKNCTTTREENNLLRYGGYERAGINIRLSRNAIWNAIKKQEVTKRLGISKGIIITIKREATRLICTNDIF